VHQGLQSLNPALSPPRGDAPAFNSRYRRRLIEQDSPGSHGPVTSSQPSNHRAQQTQTNTNRRQYFTPVQLSYLFNRSSSIDL